MRKIADFFMSSFKRGPFWGVLDLLFKAFSIFVWFVVFGLVCYFLYRTFIYAYLPENKIWWVSYCLILLISSTTLAYTALFVRRD